MPRAPFQVLVLLYTRDTAGTPRYAIFRRADMGVWQALAGGGEGGETPEQAARREAAEEAGIGPEVPLHSLASVGEVPVTAICDRAHWPSDLVMIPEYSFAMAVSPESVRRFPEHDVVEWLSYDAALERLEWASNRVALAELHARLRSAPAP